MNRESLFCRSILMVIVPSFLLPLLTGCAVLYVTASYDNETWVVADFMLVITCEGAVFGTVFEATALTTSTGYCALDLMEWGANPWKFYTDARLTNS